MYVLKYFKNTPRSPPIGRQALSVIFFFKFATRSLEKKGACRPPQPVDHKYAIRQSFAAFLLLTPLFFPEFLGSNDKEDGGIWRPGLI